MPQNYWYYRCFNDFNDCVSKIFFISPIRIFFCNWERIRNSSRKDNWQTRTESTNKQEHRQIRQASKRKKNRLQKLCHVALYLSMIFSRRLERKQTELLNHFKQNKNLVVILRGANCSSTRKLDVKMNNGKKAEHLALTSTRFTWFSNIRRNFDRSLLVNCKVIVL